MTDYNDEIYGFPLEKKYIEDESDKFNETIEEREERLKAISTEVSQARGVEAKMEIMAKQIDLLATSLQFATINSVNFVDEITRLKKKNKKLKKKFRKLNSLFQRNDRLINSELKRCFENLQEVQNQNLDLNEIVQNNQEKIVDLEQNVESLKIKTDVLDKKMLYNRN